MRMRAFYGMVNRRATHTTMPPITNQNTALASLSNHERGLSTSLVSVLTTSGTMGTGTLVHSFGSMYLSPDPLKNGMSRPERAKAHLRGFNSLL